MITGLKKLMSYPVLSNLDILLRCSETWFTPETDMSCFQIPGYTLLNEDLTFLSGGGVALYVRAFRGFYCKNLKLDLRKENWDSVYKYYEVNETYTMFLHIFNKVP